MIKKDGLVIVASLKKDLEEKVLYGRSVNFKDHYFANIRTNGIRLFMSMPALRKAQEQLAAYNSIKTTCPADMHLEIYSGEEADNLPEQKSFIAIAHEKGGLLFIGRYVEDRPDIYPLHAADLLRNGFHTFENFREAKYIASEYGSLKQCTVDIAKFELEMR